MGKSKDIYGQPSSNNYSYSNSNTSFNNSVHSNSNASNGRIQDDYSGQILLGGLCIGSLFLFLNKRPDIAKKIGIKAIGIMGLIFTLIVMMIVDVLAVFFIKPGYVYTSILSFIVTVINIIGYISLIGFVRVLMGKSFLINIKQSSTIKMILRWGIYIVCIMKITPPIVKYLDKIGGIWLYTYNPQLTMYESIAIIILMGVAGIIPAILIGFLITRFLRLHKIKEKY